MKKIIFIVLLTLVIQISSGQQCLCYHLLNSNDCSANTKCRWSGREGCVEILDQPKVVLPQDEYCSQFSNTECSGNLKCAFDQSQCVRFSGCQSFIGSTDAQCKAISQQCTTDGTLCQSKQPCSNYTQQLCLTNASSSGSGVCKWNSSSQKCQDQTCEDGWFTTDADCNKFLPGCLTNGVRCVQVKLFCQQYRGTIGTCPSFQGKDGNCKGKKANQVDDCQAKLCEDAPSNLNTDQLCSNFQQGCKTTGRGCAMTLPLCSQQKGTLTTCLDLIGRDGKCKGVSNLSYATCTLQDCQDAPTYLKTDQDCSNYIFGCITNGKGCTRQLQSCYSIFSPVGGQCEGYIGTDGLCENSTKSYCQPKTCPNAPLTHNTDALCKQYQIGCITNGKGCVNKLQPCSTYQGNQIQCDGYIGSDGPCKGINSQIQNCVPKLCKDITVANTNAICKNQLPTCVSDGVGCLDQTTCELTKKQISCQGTSGCQWNGICHSSNTCHDYLSLGVCINNTGGPNNLQCYWDDTKLVGFKCRNACQLQDFTTNTACAVINPLCRTNGTGCIDGGLPCSSYLGTRAQCENFMGLNGTIKCANLPTAVSTDVCLVRICTHNTTSTTNPDCETYLTGCVTNGAGCIPNTEPCTTYKGTQAQCNLFYGQTGSYQCYNDVGATATTACRNKLCTDISGTTVSACDTQVPGCVTDRTTCVISTRTCSSFAGTLPQCEILKGNDRRCTKISHFCRDKVCSDVPTPAQQSDCTSYLPTCRYVGSGACIDATGCASYTITGADDTAKATLCQTLTNTTGKFCTFSSGTICAEIGTGAAECSYTAIGASDTAKTTYCASFKQATNNRICVYISGTGKCGIASVCESYTPGGADDNDNTYICQYKLNSSFQACSFVASAAVCSTSTSNCQYLAYGSTTSAKFTYCTGLLGISSKCTYVEGSNNCVALGTCTTYLAAPGNEIVSCQSVQDSSAKSCFFASGTTCATPTSCTDYTAQGASNYQKAIYCYSLFPYGGCVYLIGQTTCAVLQACTAYTLVATTTADKISSCALLKNNTTGNGCTYDTGSICKATTSCAILQVLEKPPFSNCGYPAIGIDDSSKILYCANYYSSSTLQCQYDRSESCVPQQVCTGYSTSSGTDSDNSQLCQQLVGIDNLYCTFTNGSSTCGASSNSCAYTPHGTTFFDKMKYCSRFKYNNTSAYCTYSELTPTTCQTLQSSCANIQLSSFQSCYIYAVGTTTDEYLSYCKQFLDSTGYPCRYSGGFYCMPTQASCSSYDILASATADKQKICQAHTNTAGYNCIYSSGSTCSEPANTNCTQYITPASGQEAYCSNLKYSSGSVCGASSQTCTYTASDTTCSLSTNACSATGGTDSASCRLLFNQTGSTCILDSTTCIDLSGCSSYTISGGTVTSNISSCLSVYTNSSCGRCAYFGNSNCDDLPADCSSITLVSMGVSGFSTAQQQELCQSIKLNSHYCILAASTTACDVSTQCTDYTAYSSDINQNSIICSKYRGGTCRYTGNTLCQDVQANCSGYTVSGTATQNKQYCQNLTNSAGYNCSYSSGSNCSDPLSDCAYTIYGTSTVEKIQYCVKLQANSTTFCTYSSLSTTYCISTLLAKQLFCQTNRSSDGKSCSYNSGSTCTSAASCSAYSYVGDTQTDQINYCQTLTSTSGAQCTQTSTNAACTALPSSCSSYQVSGSIAERAVLCFKFKNSSGVSCYYSNSTTCSNVSSSCNVMYTGQVNTYQNQQFCNSMKYSSTQVCFSSTSSTTQCAAPSCTTTYPVGSTPANKQTYCLLKLDTNSSSCYYSSGNFCIATTVTDCSTYTAVGTAVVDRQYYCDKITATSSKQCWFLGSDTTTTTCSDLTQAQKDQLSQYCQVALYSSNSCRYDQTQQTNYCSSASGSCSNITAYGSTDSEKYNYCLKQLKSLSCVYLTGTTCAAKITNCTYAIYNASTTVEKHQYCQSFVNTNGINCAFSSGSSCFRLTTVCAYYAIGTTISDKIVYCKSLSYSMPQQQYCTYITGTTCSQSKVCVQQVIPSDKSTEVQKLTYCQQTINDDSINCTYITSNLNCSDPLPDCAYSIISTGTNTQKTTECETYKSSNGIQCTYQSGLTTCVLTTSCGKFLSSNSSQTCQANSISGQTCSYTSGSYCSAPLADCTYVAYTTDKVAYCSTLKDSFGNFCTYLNGANCSSRICVSAPSSRVISDCTTFKSFCTLDTTYQCDNLECSNNTTSTTDTVCGNYSLNCLTRNPGCIHRSEPCSSYTGTSSTCQNFKGTNQTILCWVGSGGNCKDRLCNDNTTATTDALCASHIPQPYGTTNPNCVKNQNAGVGCINYGTCASYQGTTTTCWDYLASDGPCKGTNGSTVAACAQRVCAEAPNTYNTHAQCIAYHPTCLSHGLGCTIKATATCDLFLSGNQCVAPLQNCTWASSCRTIQPICQDYTSDGYSTCVNSYSVKSICKWSAAICTFALCEDLNASYTTHQQCQNQNKLCTTSGNGCLTISKCANYSLQACLYAYTPELGNRCTVEGVCRVLKCQDGLYSTTSDCDTFLKGCITNGKYCVSSITNCSGYLEMNICKSNQCTWVQSNTFQGQCYNYTKCQDIISDNHQYCQVVSNQCTTDGKTCIPFTLCSRYTQQVSCVTGIDGTCGWSPTNQCQLFRMCSDASGKTLKQCQSFGKDCISDGTACMDKKKCRFYTTRLSCEAGGTDSNCVWENQLQACRNTQCSDAIVNRTTILGCSQFNAIQPCTTNGEQCINLNGQCSAYKTKEFCYKGLLGDCIWDKTVCRYKVCTDYQYLTTSECLTVGTTCISNGSSCILKANCSIYKTRVACYSGGNDGECTFDGQVCKRITQCSDANLDQQTCLKYPNNCNYSSDKCQQTTCQSQSAVICNSYSNFNQTSIVFCQVINGKCTQITGDQFTSSQCYLNSQYTYTWNPTSSKCEACYPNLIQNNTSPNQTNSTNQTQVSKSIMLKILIGMILFQ